MRVKYFTKKQLEEANEIAISTNRNRAIRRDVVRVLDRSTLFPIIFSMLHNDIEMRVLVALNAEPDCAFIDIPFNIFNKLDEVELV